MDSKELRKSIREIELWAFTPSDADIDKRLDEIMSLLSQNCYLKDTPTGIGKKIFELIKPIEVEK